MEIHNTPLDHIFLIGMLTIFRVLMKRIHIHMPFSTSFSFFCISFRPPNRFFVENTKRPMQEMLWRTRWLYRLRASSLVRARERPTVGEIFHTRCNVLATSFRRTKNYRGNCVTTIKAASPYRGFFLSNIFRDGFH